MKEFFKKVWQFIYKPKLWFAIVSIVCTLVFAALSLVAVALNRTSDWWIYLIYVLAALSLFFAVFACIHYGKNLRTNLLNLVGRYEFTNKLFFDKPYRMKLFSLCALAIGLGYTVFLVVMALLGKSFWYASLAEYNAVFCLTRYFVLNGDKKAKKLRAIEAEKKRVKAYTLSGLLIIFVGVQFTFSVMGIVFRGETFRYAGLMIYVFALVTFVKLTLAIVRIVRIRSHHDVTVRSIICYNLAGASISLVALQTAMFDSFGGGTTLNVAVFNAITGGVVCLFLLTLGVWVLISGKKAYKRLENYHYGNS